MLKTAVWEDVRTRVLITPPLAKHWTNLYVHSGDWMNKLCHVHSMDYEFELSIFTGKNVLDIRSEKVRCLVSVCVCAYVYVFLK